MNPMDDVDMNAGGFDAATDSGAKGSAEKKKFKEKALLPVTIRQIKNGVSKCLHMQLLQALTLLVWLCIDMYCLACSKICIV